jgi:hypothetical protein
MLRLYLRYDFYDIMFKIKHKLYKASEAAPPPPNGKFCVRTCCNVCRVPFRWVEAAGM